MEMLLNKVTGVISVEGDMKIESYEKDVYVIVNVEEAEIEGGFKLVGETEEGEKIEAFLTVEEYFEGKEFKVNTTSDEKEVVENKEVIRITEGYAVNEIGAKEYNFNKEIKLKSIESKAKEIEKEILIEKELMSEATKIYGDFDHQIKIHENNIINLNNQISQLRSDYWKIFIS